MSHQFLFSPYKNIFAEFDEFDAFIKSKTLIQSKTADEAMRNYYIINTNYGNVPMISINNCIYSIETVSDKIAFIDFIHRMHPGMHIEYVIDENNRFRFKYPHSKTNLTTVIRYNYEGMKQFREVIKEELMDVFYAPNNMRNFEMNHGFNERWVN
jgi:hypothetical protein